jgi:putative ABC transport system permease protein
MWRATWKGLLTHKVRLVLTGLAVTLGVGFVAGTFVLTDTLNQTFDRLFAEVAENIDVTVRSKAAFADDTDPGAAREPLPEGLLGVVRQVEGVREAGGFVQGYAQLVDPETGDAIQNTQAPTFGASAEGIDGLSPFTVKEGRPPAAPDEVVVDAATADRFDLEVGEEVRVLFAGPAETFTIVGTVGFGSADNLAGATFALFEIETAQRVLQRPARLDAIAVAAEEGVSPVELARRLDAALPDSAEAVTATQEAEENAESLQGELSFFGTALLVFGGVALFVGAFIIVNTFSIILAQRSRELALLRALGAARSQVTRSVLAEAVVVGLVASTIGIAAGVGVAVGLKALLAVFGIELPGEGLVVRPRAIWVPLLVGVAVTAAASYGPARRASRIPPVAAMRSSEAPAALSLRRRVVGGTIVSALALAALALGLFAGGGAGVVSAGALLLFVGIGLLSPLVARPVVRAVGAPAARLRGMPARLGRDNAMRNPRRTASTAAALTIGLGLVSFVTIFAASLKASFVNALDRSFRSDFVLQTDNFQSFSTDLGERLAGRPEIGVSSPLRFGEFRVDGDRDELFAVDPETIDEVLVVQMEEGRLADLAGGGVVVSREVADKHGWKVGDEVRMEFARTGLRPQRLVGIHNDDSLFVSSFMVSLDTYAANYTHILDSVLMVKAAPGVPVADARRAVDDVVADFPNVTARDQAEYKEQLAGQIDQLLGLVFVLLGLAVVIALIGIVNTLALSVLERTRELGLLRAVGMERRQVRQMVRWEAVLIAVLGALLGLAVGAFFGWALVTALRDEGVDTLAFPAGRLALFVVFAAVAGVLAAVFPARRASRLDVLSAIAHE